MVEIQEIIVRLEQKRYGRGMTMETFAQEIGVGSVTYRNLVGGKIKRPQAPTMKRLADALEVPIEDLVDLPGL